MTTTARSQALFASTLPGHYYYDPHIYELEQERIFSQMWVCAGRADVKVETRESEAPTGPGMRSPRHGKQFLNVQINLPIGTIIIVD